MVHKQNQDFEGNQGRFMDMTKGGKIDYSDGTIFGDATTQEVLSYLPSAVGWGGKDVFIKKTDSSTNKIVIKPKFKSGQLIDGQKSISLVDQYDSNLLRSDGQNWIIISQIRKPPVPVVIPPPVVVPPYFYEEIARKKSDVASNNLLVNQFAVKKNLKVIVKAYHTGGTLNIKMRLNDVDADVYYQKHSDNGNPYSNIENHNEIHLTGVTAQTELYSSFEIFNDDNFDKIIAGYTVSGQNVRRDFVGRFVLPDSIWEIDIFSTAGDLAVGSEVIVLGHD